MKRPAVLLAGGAVVAALVLYGIGRWSAGIDAREADAIARAHAWLEAGKARRADRARLIAAATAAQARADGFAAAARAHEASDTALNAALDRVKTAVDSLPIVLAQRDSARASVASWAQAFAALTLVARADSLRAVRAEAAADSAEARLRDILPIADCHVLGLGFLPRCPSRTVSLLIGGILGAGAVLASHR